MTLGEAILAKALMPTTASSAEIRAQFSAQIRARSVFMARNPSVRFLDKLQKFLAEIADGKINDATARAGLREFGQALGYTPEGGFPGESATPPAEAGGLKDLLSAKRLQLVLDTNTRLARSAKQQLDGSSDFALYAYPAWSLERVYSRTKIRGDWGERWRAAGDAVAWEGAAKPAVSVLGVPRMIALKGSPIWAALASGTGGYTDVIGQPMPPFAYGSGLGWIEQPREVALRLGLLQDASPKAQAVDLSPGEKEIAAALDRLGPDFRRALMKGLGGAA